jgi:hypothetical protein
MAHKNVIGIVSGQTDVIKKSLGPFYKEGFQVTEQTHLDVNALKEWIHELNNQTCFVMYSEDHPVTGELYPFVDEIDELLNQKKIRSIRISHANHFHEKIKIRPYTVRICSFDADCTVAFVGERCNTPLLLAERMHWDKAVFLSKIEKECMERKVDPHIVNEFENLIADKAHCYFNLESKRLFDRSVFYFPDVNAEALGSKIIHVLGLTPSMGWEKMSTTCVCHWGVGGHLSMFQNWWEPKPSAELLRGLLIVGLDLLVTKDFAKVLLDSYEELKQQQSWNE